VLGYLTIDAWYCLRGAGSGHRTDDTSQRQRRVVDAQPLRPVPVEVRSGHNRAFPTPTNIVVSVTTGTVQSRDCLLLSCLKRIEGGYAR